MAKHEIMIPFICHFAAGVFGKGGGDLTLSYEEVFEKARIRGWSDDPDDRGGATMVDVTLSTYKTFRLRKGLPLPDKDDLRKITFEEWVDILKTMFWNRCGGDKIVSQGIANLITDWVWASGFSVLKRVQRILGVVPDGKVGLNTLAAINSFSSAYLFEIIKREREKYYRGCPGAWKYLKGWLRRLHSIQPDGSFLINGVRI
ncbi:MAG: peptidoglycan domain protein [Muribaculaceae bacterium]|nr:peptidoglycan domain protein [Muribaculaceae bacterium]MDE6753094.1 peptidoglycan domain protein [Muribaculaceae bacterium]